MTIVSLDSRIQATSVEMKQKIYKARAGGHV